MGTREADFAGRWGYTPAELDAMIENLLITHKSPVWAIFEIAYHLFKADTRDPQYRQVQRSVYKLQKQGKLVVDNLWQANNITIVYAKCRFNTPPKEEIPF